ncbi:FAD-dependent monooxygenase [Streptomyces sp. NBC_00091]|uniref:FAD-dependent monooxygenase n=1 Tax=Streptomyces sp. NBC_00091 TaxID=2975648 RepID=UPI00224F6363|nr:FAD-dependent monooxygenase [Streptomyces sp. NBC_00091]MCX5380904.1 FAD-dependent monooxygenase [Streptomyces sp. NBC_00091]
MTDVLIAGSGPTGLTLACELALRGVSVRVLDQRPGPHRESRGKGLTPGSLEVFARLGAAERISAIGARRMVLRKYFDGAHIQDTATGGGVLIAQWQVEDVLRERLAGLGVRIEYEAQVAGIAQEAGGVTVRLADGRSARAGYLAGCDGGHSSTRRLLGIPFEGHTEEAPTMVIGDVRAPGLSREYWHQWFTSDGGGMMLCPMPETDTFQLQASPELDGDGRPLAPSLEGLQRLFDRHARMEGIRLADPTWMSTWRVNVRMAARMREGRVFLAGDAAHVHPIAGGLGMNTGIQDAAALGRTLAGALTGQGGEDVLDGYEAERLPAAAEVLADTTERHRRVLEAVREPGRGTEAGLD